MTPEGEDVRGAQRQVPVPCTSGGEGYAVGPFDAAVGATGPRDEAVRLRVLALMARWPPDPRKREQLRRRARL